jgi:hypothetical protein
MEKRNRQIIEERRETLEGKVADAICVLWHDDPSNKIRFKQIADKLNEGIDNPDFKVTPKRVGGILRKSFNLNIENDNRGHFLEKSEANREKLARIARRFGVDWDSAQQRSQRSQCSPCVEIQQVTG